jgi:hypothetical protein
MAASGQSNRFRKGPNLAGYCRWRVNFRYRPEAVDGQCRLCGNQVSVHYAVELPNDLVTSFLAIVDNRVTGSGLSVMNNPNLL